MTAFKAIFIAAMACIAPIPATAQSAQELFGATLDITAKSPWTPHGETVEAIPREGYRATNHYALYDISLLGLQVLRATCDVERVVEKGLSDRIDSENEVAAIEADAELRRLQSFGSVDAIVQRSEGEVIVYSIAGTFQKDGSLELNLTNIVRFPRYGKRYLMRRFCIFGWGSAQDAANYARWIPKLEQKFHFR